MISIKNLNKIYESGTKAIENLNMSVERGEIFALLGPNGAGKSSTIRILTTLSGFDDGEVIVAGHNVDVAPEKVRAAIGYVAQDTGVDFFLSGRENLTLQGHLYKLSKSEIETRIAELAKYFALEEVLDDMVSSYSGGMRRKLDIATALIHKPEIIFLDEPTLGLDTQSRRNLWEYIQKLNNELGLTILLTTHYLDEADKLASRVAIIDKGQIKTVGKPEELKDQIQGDVVSLQFDELDDKNRISDALSKNGYVKEHKWEQNKLHLYVSNGASCIPQLIEQCNALNQHVKNVSFARPSLDDVFIKITGASIEAKEEVENKWWEKWAGKGGGAWAKKWQEHNKESAESGATPDWHEEAGRWSEEEQKQWWEQQNQAATTESPAEEKPEKSENDWQAQASQWSKEEQEQWWAKQQADTSGEIKDNSTEENTMQEDENKSENENSNEADWQKEANKWTEEEQKEWWAKKLQSESSDKTDEKKQDD